MIDAFFFWDLAFCFQINHYVYKEGYILLFLEHETEIKLKYNSTKTKPYYLIYQLQWLVNVEWKHVNDLHIDFFSFIKVFIYSLIFFVLPSYSKTPS